MRHPRPSFPALSPAISVFAMILYVGSYSAEPLHGLRVFQMDEQTGALTALSCVEDAADPIYLALSPDKRFLYVAENVTKTALIVVGRILEGEYDRSKLYDPSFTTEFRKGSDTAGQKTE